MRRVTFLLCLSAAFLLAQSPKDVRAVAKQGPAAIPTVAAYLNSANADTRIEAVKQLIALGGKDTIDPLIRATHDADPEVQFRATDGLVNFYLPGYVRQGMASTVIRVGESVKAKFSDKNDQMIDAFVVVRPEVITALGQLARSGSAMDTRANACRAIGILRGRAALPDLIDALRTKNNVVMYEALAAMEKIGDPSVGPKITYLLHDFDDRVQSTAIEASGVLRNTDALPILRSIVANSRNIKSERSALAAIAMMPQPQDREVFLRELGSKDERLRVSAAEGLARIGNPADEPALAKVWHDEDKMAPRLAAAFALTEAKAAEGKTDLTEESPLRYLINTLNSAAYHEIAYSYLVEAARRKLVLDALYTALGDATTDEKIYIARVLMVSGDKSSIPWLDKISRDNQSDVSKEGLRALRSLRARLGA